MLDPDAPADAFPTAFHAMVVAACPPTPTVTSTKRRRTRSPDDDRPQARVVSVARAARILRLTPAQVRRLIHTGALPHIRLGRRMIRIPKSALP
jgi:excisionase family DNA binding protein